MFCPNCGNELRENSRFCTACGTPVRNEIPVQQTVPTVPLIQPVFVQSQTASSVKQKLGLDPIFVIFSAILSGLAVISYFILFRMSFRINFYSLRSIVGVLSILDIITYILGIVAGALSRKLPVLMLIPGAMMIVTNVVSIIQNVGYIFSTKDQSYITTMSVKVLLPIVIEILIMVVAFVFFVLAVVNKNKIGMTLGLVAGFIFVFLIVLTFWLLMIPFINSFKYIHNLQILFRAYTHQMVSFSRLFLYASFMLTTFGVYARNRKYIKQI